MLRGENEGKDEVTGVTRAMANKAGETMTTIGYMKKKQKTMRLSD